MVAKATRKTAAKKVVKKTAKKVAKRTTHRGAGQDGSQVRIRHYCQGIGDCHLLRFTRDDGTPFFMLIDCGVHTFVLGGAETMRRIVANIASVTRRIDVLVVTHEHWDHVSGFRSAAKQFEQIEVDEVWLAWTENPADPQARQLDTYKGQALAALQAASQQLQRRNGLDARMRGLREGLEAVLGFNFGAKGDSVRAARNAGVALAQGEVRYLEPADKPLSPPGLSNLRIFVMGPPRDKALLGVTERASEMYGLGGPDWSMASALYHGLKANLADLAPGEDPAAPFDPNVGMALSTVLDENAFDADAGRGLRDFIRDRYAGPVHPSPGKKPRKSADPNRSNQAWRRIDDDWLGTSAELAMQLDNRTNNTSLVLAFEFIDTGRVLLFTADAQVGSWLSWQDLSWRVDSATVTGPDLLARTVYLKVGHHGSENATLKGKGLELMTNPDLSAFIPTNEKDARKVNWGRMPFKDILEALEERTGGRVIRADDAWIASGSGLPGFDVPSGSLRAVQHGPGLWVEFEVA